MDTILGKEDSMAARSRMHLAAILVVAATGACTSTNESEPEHTGLDRSTVDQIQTSIANFATLRESGFNDNVELLGNVLRAHSIPYLLEALETNSDPKIRGGCAMALGVSQDGSAVEPLHRVMTRDRDEGMRYTAAYNLCLFRDSRGIPTLIEALRSTNSRYRYIGNARLMEVTGLDFAYEATAMPAKRNAAAERWDAWYRQVGPEGAGLRLLSKKSGNR
jgi:hypothetical protein